MPHMMMPKEEKPKSRGTVYMVGKKAPSLKVGTRVEVTLQGTVESLRQDAEGYDVSLTLTESIFTPVATRSSLGQDMKKAEAAKRGQPDGAAEAE